jgi:predicted nucleic acid-binding protein
MTMEAWSHTSVKEFKTTFFFDTNILSYLIDETYPLLNKFVKYLKASPIINLVSSEYVLLEFIGIRKREHYLRKAIIQSRESDKTINISSLLKKHDQFDLPEINFYSLLPDIRKKVDAEKERITSEFGITFCNGFHHGLFNLTLDICLSSKISKEDSLVLASSVLPNEGEKNSNVILITNDNDFHKWFNDENIRQDIDIIFQNHAISKPNLQHIAKLEGNNARKFNLTENKENIENVIEGLTVYLCKNLKRKLKKIFLGETFSAKNANFPQDCICLKAEINKSIPNHKYLTVIDKNLDFIYNIEHKISFLNNRKEIPDDGFISTKENNNLSFLLNIDDRIPDKSIILAKLKEAGNLIFLHPNN